MACGKAFCSCCLNAYAEGFWDGLTVGVAVGYSAGFFAGVKVGRKLGYKKGYIDGYSDSSLGIDPPAEYKPLIGTRIKELSSGSYGAPLLKDCGCLNTTPCIHTMAYSR